MGFEGALALLDQIADEPLRRVLEGNLSPGCYRYRIIQTVPCDGRQFHFDLTLSPVALLMETHQLDSSVRTQHPRGKCVKQKHVRFCACVFCPHLTTNWKIITRSDTRKWMDSKVFTERDETRLNI